MVDISPTAIKEIKRIRANPQNSARSLRLAVKAGGCCGLFYDLKFEENEITSMDDNLARDTGDRLLEISGIDLRIDVESWKYLKNLKLDYSEDLMGGGFRFNNPQIKSSCGCGISFNEVE